MNWELIHRWNSVVIGLFIVAHLGVHLFAVASPEAHAGAAGVLRQYYRDPLLEVILLSSLLIQIVSGYAELKLFVKPGWRLVRNLSGLYLIAFMALHVGTVMYARHIDHVPTDFYWAAGAFALEPLRYGAMGFYGLGVFSFFTHMIAVCALTWKSMPRSVLMIFWSVAIIITTLILLAFSGLLYKLDIPMSVIGYYEAVLAQLPFISPYTQ